MLAGFCWHGFLTIIGVKEPNMIGSTKKGDRHGSKAFNRCSVCGRNMTDGEEDPLTLASDEPPGEEEEEI